MAQKKKIAELVIDLTTNMANFQRDLNSARKEVRDFGESLTGTFSKLKSLAVVAGEAFALTQTFEFVHKMTESMEALGKAAQKAGVTVEAMSSLRFAAHMADVDAETLSMGLTKLSKAMLGIEQSSKMTAAKTALQQLGIETANLKSADEVMLKIADRFSKMEDGARKTGLAMEIFGKSGAQLIPFLNQGSASIERMVEEARRLGVVLDKEAIERAEKFEDSLKLIKAQAQGVGYQFVQQLLPALNDFMKALSGSTDKMSAFVKAGNGMAGTMRQAAILAELGRAQWNREALEGKILGAKMDLGVMQLGTAVVANPEAIKAQKKHIQDLQDQLAKSWDETGRNLAVLRGDIPVESLIHGGKNDAGGAGNQTIAAEFSGPFMIIKDRLDDLIKSADIAWKKVIPPEAPGDLVQIQAQIEEITNFLNEHPGVLFPNLNYELAQLEAAKLKIEAPMRVNAQAPDITDTPSVRDWKQIGDLIPEVTVAAGKYRQVMQDMAAETGTAFSRFISYGFRWQQLLQDLIGDVLKLLLTMSRMNMPAAKASSGSGVSGFFGAFVSGFAGMRASGGDVDAGRPYLVGERGPEPFIPRTSGTILPNDFLRNSAGNRGGGDTYIIDATGTNAADVEYRVREATQRAHTQAVMTSMAAERERMARVPSRRRFGG